MPKYLPTSTGFVNHIDLYDGQHAAKSLLGSLKFINRLFRV
jgi:hypothetical protein